MVSIAKRYRSILYLVVTRGVGILLQFLMQVVVGRLTGAYGVGALQLCATLTSALGEVNALGLPTHAMKSLARTQQKLSRLQIYRYLKAAFMRLAVFWLLMLLSYVVYLKVSGTEITSLVTSTGNDSDGKYIIAISLVAALAYASMRLFADSLKSLGQLNKTVFLENAGAPLIVLMACAAAYLYGQNVSARSVLLIFCAAFISVAILLVFLLNHTSIDNQETEYQLAHSNERNRDLKQQNVASSNDEIKISSKEILPFWGTSILSIVLINYPFMIVAFFSTLDDIGVFAVAFKLTNTVTAVIVMLGAIYGPRYSAASKAGDTNALFRLLVRTQFLSLLIYLPLIGALYLFLGPITQLFGNEFAGVSVFVLILAGGQLVNAASGLPGLLLNMTGYGKCEFIINLLVVSIAIVTGFLAGLHHGIIGVAVVYALSISFKNVLSYLVVLVTLGKVRLPAGWTTMTSQTKSATSG